jgi:hypothetical protein
MEDQCMDTENVLQEIVRDIVDVRRIITREIAYMKDNKPDIDKYTQAISDDTVVSLFGIAKIMKDKLPSKIPFVGEMHKYYNEVDSHANMTEREEELEKALKKLDVSIQKLSAMQRS